MTLTEGTVLEPKFDISVGHAVITDVALSDKYFKIYEVTNIKSKNRALMTGDEILNIYDPVGQEEAGRILFGRG